MIRHEFILVGCILVVVGLGLCIVGYNKTLPSVTDSAISFLEGISGEKAPAELRTDKTGGYVFMAWGVICFLAGCGMILKSRSASTETINSEGDDR